MVPESITTGILALVAFAAPAVIIVVVVAFFIPGRGLSRKLKRQHVIRLKLWEFERGWAGLALSIAMAVFATQALKNMFGKPRPNCIATCQPDLDNVAKYVVGGLGQSISERWTLVSSKICMSPDKEAFRSFPSGHASFSFSGLLYLSLFLCSKFAISFPYLPIGPRTQISSSDEGDEPSILPLQDMRPESAVDGDTSKFQDDAVANMVSTLPVRSQAASPPTYLLVLALTPIAVAIYVCSTRYVEFYHQGFDIICGALVGIFTSWLSFRWIHLPLGRGEGWAWGARSRQRAFGVGVGVYGYVGKEGWETGKTTRRDPV